MLDYDKAIYNYGEKMIIRGDEMTVYQHQRGSIDILIVRYVILDKGKLQIVKAYTLSCSDEKDAYNEFCKIRNSNVGYTKNYHLWRLYRKEKEIVTSDNPTKSAGLLLIGKMDYPKKLAITEFMEDHNLEIDPDELMWEASYVSIDKAIKEHGVSKSVTINNKNQFNNLKKCKEQS